MFKHEINRLFTAKVTEYIGKGYWLNPDTMGGSQGEIAKVDLTDGKEFIRILLDNKPCFDGTLITLKVGRDATALNDANPSRIWNSDLEILEETDFYKVSENLYVTPEEYPAIREKRLARYKALHDNWNVETLGDAAKKIVLPFVRRQPKCGRVKAGDIERVRKVHNGKRLSYSVKAKGQTFWIH